MVDRQQVVTGVLCAVAAVAASAVVATLAPPPEAQAGGRPAAAHASATPKSSAPTAGSSSRPQLNGGAAQQSPGQLPSRPGPSPSQSPGRPAGSPAPGAGPAAAPVAGVLFQGADPGSHFCTATVVHSAGRNLIVTAGHCLADSLSGADGAYFAPAYAHGVAPYGSWRLEQVFEDNRWADDGDDDYDLAFARLAPNAAGVNVESAVGGAPLDTTGRSDEDVTITGFPSGREEPRVCTSRAVRESPTLQRFDCADFPGGTSGSAWIGKDGKIIGVLTGGDTDDVSTSTVLDTYAAELYRKASGLVR
ncbi:trypsin-like serine peptidase [Streptomyces sp. NPDC090022]|uniref:trypsin-like serine peptidase n=1 Tax=Streptomyces sp. NPDC090022 TaxID=3365920 RepID=UPI00380F2501